MARVMLCILVLFANEVLFWLGVYYLSSAIPIALAYVISGACNTMKRELDGDHQNKPGRRFAVG